VLVSRRFGKASPQDAFGFEKARHFALSEKVLTLPTKARALKSGSGRKVSPPISSGLAPMIVASNSPPSEEAGCPFKRSI
jgi:hypothetical protein